MFDISNSIEWLASYYEQSASVAPRFKTPQFAISVLTPLVKVVPYVPKDKPLVHLKGMDNELTSSLQLSPLIITSYTWETSASNLEDIADSVGINGYPHYGAYKPRPGTAVHELFNTTWVVSKVIPQLKKIVTSDRWLTRLEEAASGFLWQKEVVCFHKTPAVLTLVRQLGDEA